jgi:hypothetical protein
MRWRGYGPSACGEPSNAPTPGNERESQERISVREQQEWRRKNEQYPLCEYGETTADPYW